jgi:hypothetical protein
MTMAQPKATRAAELPQEYKIVDPKVKADSAGQLGGQRVYTKGEDRFVKLTHSQAEWFIQHGAIELAPFPGQQQQPPPPQNPPE